MSLARAERAEITLPNEQILSVTTFPAIDPDAAGASVVQIAKNVTEEIRSARQLRQMSDELAKTNALSNCLSGIRPRPILRTRKSATLTVRFGPSWFIFR